MVSSSQRSHFRGKLLQLAHVLAGSSGQALGSVVFAIVTTRFLIPEERGALVIFASTSILLAILGNGGVETEGRRMLAQGGAGSIALYRAASLRASFVVAIASSTVGALLLWLTGSMVALVTLPLLVVFSVSQSQLYLARNGLYGMSKYAVASYVTTGVALVPVVGVILLRLAGQLNYWTSIGLLIATSLVGSALLWHRLLNFKEPSDSKAARQSPWKMYRRSIKASPGSFGQHLFKSGDRILLGIVAGPVAVATYAAGAAISAIPGLIAGASSHVVQTETAKNPTRQSGRHERFTLIVTTLVVALLCVASPFVVPWVFGPEYITAVPVAQVSLLSAILSATHSLQLAAYKGRGAYAAIFANQSAGLIALVILVPALGLAFGALGAAIGAFVTRTIMVVAWRFGRQRHDSLGQRKVVLLDGPSDHAPYRSQQDRYDDTPVDSHAVPKGTAER